MRDFIKLLLALAVGAFVFSSLANNVTFDVRVFSPSAVASGETAIAIIGDGNSVALNQTEAKPSPQPQNSRAGAAFIFFLRVVGAIAVFGTIGLLSYGHSGFSEEDDITEKSPQNGRDSWS